MTIAQWQPHDVTDLDIAFPANVRHLMPAWEDIPEEFKGNHHPYVRFANRLFDGFLRGGETVIAKDGIDALKAGRHIQVIMRSFEPKHEHKIAATAYLMSLWFESIEVD